METPENYFAHSENDAGCRNPLLKHLTEVAALANDFAEVFGGGECARVAGLLHDLGKYGDLFQRRLEGLEGGLDHWTIGASVCLEKFKQNGVLPALAIQGHHLGLQWWARDELTKLLRRDIGDGRRLTEEKPEILLERFHADGLTLPERIESLTLDSQTVAEMLDVRLLFSALTDADYLATEKHFKPQAAEMREPAASLKAAEAETALDEYLAKLAQTAGTSSSVARMRADLLEACREGSQMDPGLFTLSAPTGSGKTLSTLAFALRHARRNGMRRVVVVLPFLSIIDQTARVYRDALAGMAADQEMERYILEHHSLAMDGVQGDGDGSRLRGMIAENWDAPIIITTSVQFLESLFSNSPSTCRKLHRLARSVVVFDEVQTLPLKIALPTLAALSHLSARYETAVVFSTATQPAFNHLDARVREFCSGGWNPRPIVPEGLGLFDRARRVRVWWPAEEERLEWEDLAERLEGSEQALCIVNLKKHARQLFEALKGCREDGTFHLSTAMCPKHRGEVLAQVRRRLDAGERCRLVSTQCVEAGVDLDFPVVFRALAPLDSIAQAAGRCNRNGNRPAGDMHVFVPADVSYPPGVYKQAADVTAILLKDKRGIDIDTPETFERYFRLLYDVARLEDKDLVEAIKTKRFPDVRRHYRVIDQDAVNVLVAYDVGIHTALAEEVRTKGLTRDWVRRARPHAVGCYRRALDYAMVEPVFFRARGGKRLESGDWFVYLRNEHYDPDFGLSIPKQLDYLEG
ncbi:MAG: CRISPR-associated helicase Cas3' [Bryobacterales bacterium]|nr:CRISPR-associated helicase Cas3' [Bryobacterales bacterium]